MLEAIARESAHFLYRFFIYPALVSGQVCNDRELAHERALMLMENYMERNKALHSLLSRLFIYKDPILEQEIFGLKFNQPCMVSAGFDKNARVYQTLASLGMPPDIGTICRWPYGGEKKPRVFMLDDDLGSINRMRYPSDGLHEITGRLKQKYVPRNKRDYNIFLNFGINQPSFEKGTPIFDLAMTYHDLYDFGDILTLAVSPNTPDSLGILEPQKLSDALNRLANIRKSKKEYKPLLLKLTPDLTYHQVDAVVDTALSGGVDGFVLTNTTLDPQIKNLIKGNHKDEPGGYSGKLLRTKALNLSHHIFAHTEGTVPILAAGGLGQSSLDLYDALIYGGARIFQMYTYFVHPKYSSPLFSYRLNKGLAKELRNHGFKNITEAVGIQAF